MIDDIVFWKPDTVLNLELMKTATIWMKVKKDPDAK